MPSVDAMKAARTAEGFLIRVAGRGTLRESPAVLAFAIEALADDGRRVHLDLSQCEYLDSTFLGSLVKLHKEYSRSEEPRFLLLAPSEKCLRLLMATGLHQLLHVVEERPRIDGPFVDIPTGAVDLDDLGRHVIECHRQLCELGTGHREQFGGIVDRLTAEIEGRAAKERPSSPSDDT